MNNIRGGSSLVLIILIVMYLSEGNYKIAILWVLIGLGINGFGYFNNKQTKHIDENNSIDEE